MAVWRKSEGKANFLGFQIRIYTDYMNTKLNQFCISTTLTLAILFCPSAALPQENKDGTNASPTFAQELMRSMEVMDKDMMDAPMTGAPDHDFCAMMSSLVQRSH